VARARPTKLRGAASSIDIAADTFVINGRHHRQLRECRYSGPAGAGESSLRNGTVVEIRGTLGRQRVHRDSGGLEDLKDDSLLGRPMRSRKSEGFVSGFTAIRAASWSTGAV